MSPLQIEMAKIYTKNSDHFHKQSRHFFFLFSIQFICGVIDQSISLSVRLIYLVLRGKKCGVVPTHDVNYQFDILLMVLNTTTTITHFKSCAKFQT